MTRKGPLSNTHQTDCEIETVLRQLVPASETLAPAPESHVSRSVVNLARFGPGFKVLAVVAFLVLAGRCAYLQHKLSEVSNEAAIAKAEAGACEGSMQRQIPSDAADERGVRSDLEATSRRIRGVGPIQQTAPGVFTNRDADPAELPSR
jgi:hypothetical protein